MEHFGSMICYFMKHKSDIKTILAPIYITIRINF